MAERPTASETPEYEFEMTAGRDEIADVLNGVVDGILAGAVRLGAGDDAVSVDVPDDLSLEIEFEDEADGSSLELELEWPAPDGAATDRAIENRSDGAPEEPTPVSTLDGSESLARFEVFRDRGDEWRWRLRHRNGNVIAIGGEGYTRKHNAQKGLRSVIENAATAELTETVTE